MRDVFQDIAREFSRRPMVNGEQVNEEKGGASNKKRMINKGYVAAVHGDNRSDKNKRSAQVGAKARARAKKQAQRDQSSNDADFTM